MPIEYDYKHSPIPRAKHLLYCQTKRIFMKMKCCLFFIHRVCPVPKAHAVPKVIQDDLLLGQVAAVTEEDR